jgi:hypothetical protein
VAQARLHVTPEYSSSIIKPIDAIQRNKCIYCENHREIPCEAERRFSFVTSEKVVLPVHAMKVCTGRSTAPLILGVGTRSEWFTALPSKEPRIY